MAMIKCTECGNEISDKAASCPRCGCPMDAILKANEDEEQVKGEGNINRTIIIVFLMVALILVGVLLWYFKVKLPKDEAMAEYTALVETYNTEVERYNSIVDEYNAKVDGIISANSKLDNAISEAKKVIDSGNVPYDADAVTRLDVAITDAQSKEQDVPGALEKEAVVEENTLLSENSDVESASVLVNDELVVIEQAIMDAEKANEQLAIPDYNKMIAEISDFAEELEKSYAIHKQITYPTQEFVLSKLNGVENVSVIACVTKENDPNGKLGTEGGYTAQIFFSSPLLKTENISEDELLEIGTDAGGSIEIYATVEDAEARNEYLASFDGSTYDTGKHSVLGTMVVRVSTNLTTTKQDVLSEALIEALTMP